MKQPIPPYYAQNGEDKILARIFAKIGTANRQAVEFGADDGLRKSNTAYFRLMHGWRVTLFDQVPRADIVHGVTITPDNINAIFSAYEIPGDLDLLSIDVDGNDLWIWRALTSRPRVVVVEYNPRWWPRKSRVMPFNPDHQWDGTDYYGASVRALVILGHQKGYTLAGSTRSNLIFARTGLLPEKRIGTVRRAMTRKSIDPYDRKWLVYR